MSRMTPWGYYEAFVLHNLWDYERSPYDIRLGMNACVSAFQLADVMYFYYKRKKPDRIQPWPEKKDFLTDLSSRDLGFLTVQSVATAYKHLYTNKAFYEIESGGAMSSFRVPADDVNLEPDWASDVFVLRRDGTKTSLKGALKNVVEKLWPSVLPHDEN